VTDPPSAETTAADDVILRQYTAAIVDIRAMRVNVLTLWRDEISMMLPDMSDIAGHGYDGAISQGAANSPFRLAGVAVNRPSL
jgi:hypothetical protein